MKRARQVAGASRGDPPTSTVAGRLFSLAVRHPNGRPILRCVYARTLACSVLDRDCTGHDWQFAGAYAEWVLDSFETALWRAPRSALGNAGRLIDTIMLAVRASADPVDDFAAAHVGIVQSAAGHGAEQSLAQDCSQSQQSVLSRAIQCDDRVIGALGAVMGGWLAMTLQGQWHLGAIELTGIQLVFLISAVGKLGGFALLSRVEEQGATSLSEMSHFLLGKAKAGRVVFDTTAVPERQREAA